MSAATAQAGAAAAQAGATGGERARAGDPHRLGHGDERPIGERGPAPKRIIVGYGFWIFLLSDFIMFAAFFAAYAVLVGEIAGGPSGRELFDLPFVLRETMLLLLSSFTCGMATIATARRDLLWFQLTMAATGVLGAGFLGMELWEFRHLIGENAGPDRSAFLSGFFALVGLHGVHVLAGLLWLATMMAQVWAKGFREDVERRIMCWALFWHALDIIWVAVFTVVYLFGVIQ